MAANSQVSGNVALEATAAQLRMPNIYKYLNFYHQQKFNYIGISELLREKIKTESIPAATTDLKINTMVLDASNLSAPITNRYMSGSNMVIEIGTTQGNFFRPNATILNKNGMKLGIRIATTDTSVTIAPMQGDTLSITDWTIGSFITEGKILVPDAGSSAVKGRTIVPRVIYDNLNTFRVNRAFNRTDFTTSFVDQTSGMVNGQGLVNLQMDDMSYDMMCQMEYQYIFGKMGTQSISNESSDTSMGFLESVDKRGGVPILSTEPITWSRYINLMGDIFDNYNADYNEIITLCGSKFRTNIVLSAEAQGYKTTAGQNSVLEGSGLDFITVYGPLGKLTFVNFGLFNDKYMMPSTSEVGGRFLQESAIFFSVTNMKGQNGGIVPMIQDYYGSYGQNSSGIHASYTGGLVDKNGKFVQEAFNQNDSVVFGQIAHASKVIPNAQPCGYFMLT